MNAEELMHALGEKDSSDRTKLQLMFIVKKLTETQVKELYKSALIAFANEEKTKDELRLRTLGGCFFTRVPKDVKRYAALTAKEILKARREIEAA